jgi:uncharacterized protein (DUF1800 family)
MSTRDAVTALRRFGLGARPGELKSAAGDPRGYLAQQLQRFAPQQPEAAGLRTSFAGFEALQVEQREKRQREQELAKQMQAMPADQAAKTASMQPWPDVVRETFQAEQTHRFQRACQSSDGFIERLTAFWSDHFCISADKAGPVRVMTGAYEREAIRPYILGRFVDMLMASAMHPAMIIYLDNQQSIGPASRAGGKGRGLNENLAREIMELHTLGVDGGYSQEDVTNFARILTGWTVGGIENAASNPGRFFFAPARHEPGDITVMGKAYKDEGQITGQRVLEDLARHPATARHIARKLARHFVGEAAPAALVERLQQTFTRTDGDLKAVTQALVQSPEAWSPSAVKLLPPLDLVIATCRALAIEPKEAPRFTTQLGQPLWRPPSPKGWPDEDNAWTAPSAMRERLRVAELAARQVQKGLDPRQVADDIFGDALSEPTRTAIARAEVREQGFELLLMSPEFQRR